MNIFQKLFPESGTQIGFKSLAPKKEQDYQAIIQEIHGSIDWLSELMIKPSDKITATQARIDALKNNPIVNTVARKKAIGFGITDKEQAESMRIDEQIREQRKEQSLLELKVMQLERLEQIRQKYPFYKFVLRSDVEKLCEKYNLALGYTIHYKGDLPEKNLKEIEAYKPTEDDLKIYKKQSYSRMSMTESYVIRRPETHQRSQEFNSLEEDAALALSNFYSMSLGRMLAGVERDRLQEVKSFIIACPAQDLTQTINHVKVTEVPDPIVFAPVGEEYIWRVVSKWGLEANDELVVNPIEN